MTQPGEPTDVQRLLAGFPFSKTNRCTLSGCLDQLAMQQGFGANAGEGWIELYQLESVLAHPRLPALLALKLESPANHQGVGAGFLVEIWSILLTIGWRVLMLPAPRRGPAARLSAAPKAGWVRRGRELILGGKSL